MEIFEFMITKTTKVRHYKVDCLTDICWLYETNEMSYQQAVRQVKLQCALNVGLAERRLYLELTKRGKRLPMVSTRKIKETIVRPDKELSIREEVNCLFKDAKHLRSK